MTKPDLTALIRASPITHQQGKNVLLALLHAADRRKEQHGTNEHWAVLRVTWSQRRIGLLCGLSQMTTHRHILSLIKLGAIARRRWEGKAWVVIREKKIQEMIEKASKA